MWEISSRVARYQKGQKGDEVLPYFYAAVAKHFGKGAKINYRLPKD